MMVRTPLVSRTLRPARAVFFRPDGVAARLAACAPLLLALALVATPALAQNDLRDIPDPDPAKELATFTVAEGFEVNLFASEPMVAKPINMNFDERGRLWVAGSSIYPHIKPGADADDKVYVLEDLDGDGRADTSTVFVENLLIPTGLIPGDGGLYVANSTELLHLSDTDGDGRADRTRVVLSGFGTEDTHHILHTFRWSYDGTLSMNQSIYIHSHVETPHGPRRLNAGGVWRFRPETMELEVFTRGLVNSWGRHYDRWGADFQTDGAGGAGINYAFPGAVFETAYGAERVVNGLNPGSPKHCGLEVISGTHLPEDWRGSLVTNDFRGHRVCRFVLSPDGSGFASREMGEIIKSPHVAFRPIDAKMGPDGAIYIADWYNPIIQHGEVDFRDERRDRVHGRIWRVTAKGRPLVPRPKLAEATNAELVAALGAEEDFTRGHAKRLLRERALGIGASTTKSDGAGSTSTTGATGAASGSARAEILAEISRWLEAQGPGLATGDEAATHRVLEGLWALQGLREKNWGLLQALLASPDPRARAAAVRVIPDWYAGVKVGRTDWPAMLGERARDENGRVRLEAVRALAAFPEPRSAGLAMRALDQPVDRFLDFALWQTARDLKEQWLPALAGLDANASVKAAEAGAKDANANVFEEPAHAVFALLAIRDAASVPPLVRMIGAGEVPAESEDAVLRAIAERGGASELAILLESVVGQASSPVSPSAVAQASSPVSSNAVAQASSPVSSNTQAGTPVPPSDGLTPERRAVLLDGLVRAARARGVRPEGDLARILPLLDASAPGSEPLRAAAARAAGAWGLQGAAPRLIELAAAPDTSPALRGAVIDGLAGLAAGDAAARASLDALAAGADSGADAGAGDSATRFAAAAAVASIDLTAGANFAARALAEAPEGTNPTPAVDAFLRRDGGGKALAEALGRAMENGTGGENEKENEGEQEQEQEHEKAGDNETGARATLLAPDLAKLAARAVRMTGRPEPELLSSLEKAGGLGDDAWDLPPDQLAERVAALVEESRAHGDPARGEALFRSESLQCFKCHAIGGAGGLVGPDMSSLGASAQPDYILEAVVLPSKAIKENFHSLNVTTKSGDVFSGIKVRQTTDALLLRDANDQEIAIPLADIAEQSDGLSLMPTGLVDALTRAELADLVRFLSALGREDAYSVKPGRAIRTWRALLPSDATAIALHAKGYQHAAEDDDAFVWAPIYAKPSGALPLDEAPRVRPKWLDEDFRFLRFEVDVTTPGEVALELDSVEGVTMWLDGRPLEPATKMKLDLATGRRRFTLAVEAPPGATGAAGELNARIADVPGSPAQAAPVGGK